MSNHAFVPACILALALPATAQSLPVGLSVGSVLPTSDLHTFNPNTGAALGGFLDVDLGGGYLLCPRMDVILLPHKTENEGSACYNRDFWGGSVGVDYDWYLAGARRGFYLQVGSGFYHMEARTRSVAGRFKQNTNQFGGSFGCGYDFKSSWGMSLRFAYSTFRSDLPSQQVIGNPTAGIVILSSNHRF